MFNILKRGKLNINSISIPDFGWIKEKDTESILQWINPEQAMALSINFFPAKPDIPSVKDIDKIRQFYRKSIIQTNGGLISVELANFSGIPGIKTIFKIPQESAGTTYLASCTIPFAKYSYVIKIQAPELGIPGFRESAISRRLIEENKITSTKEGWLSDPYDKDFKGGTLMNLSEGSTYDEQFPKHPLTQARRLINEIADNITFKVDLGKVRRFNH